MLHLHIKNGRFKSVIKTIKVKFVHATCCHVYFLCGILVRGWQIGGRHFNTSYY